MINLYLAQIITNDNLREAENARLIGAVNQSRKNQTRQRLAKLACRFGLIQTC